jgi:hypothetical protein
MGMLQVLAIIAGILPGFGFLLFLGIHVLAFWNYLPVDSPQTAVRAAIARGTRM